VLCPGLQDQVVLCDNVNDLQRLRLKLAVVRDGCTGSILFCSPHLCAGVEGGHPHNAAIMARDLGHVLDCGWIDSADGEV
jgi:hypothetical protein